MEGLPAGERSPCLKLSDESGPCGAFPAVFHPTPTLALGEERDGMKDGPIREWHVSETGRDGRDGTVEQPVRTIQFAVDRARPGDTVIIHPGLYPDPVRISRGGTKDRPVTIRAAEQWKAVLDPNRHAPVMIEIAHAPHIRIDGLEIR